jgi:hypothetical protein
MENGRERIFVKARKAIADISNALGGNPYAVKPK